VKNIKFKYRKKETKKVYTCRRLSQKAKKKKRKNGKKLVVVEVMELHKWRQCDK